MSVHDIWNETCHLDARGDLIEFHDRLFDMLFDSAQARGDLTTPEDVVRFAVRLLGHQSNETVYDPACGSRGMFLKFASIGRLVGSEIDEWAARCADIRLNVFGNRRIQILHENPLNPACAELRYDRVICHTPLPDEESADRVRNRLKGSSSSCVRMLRPDAP